MTTTVTFNLDVFFIGVVVGVLLASACSFFYQAGKADALLQNVNRADKRGDI